MKTDIMAYMYAFIDESGDHNFNVVTSDNQYSVFVLGGVFIRHADYAEIDKEFKAFKKDFFGGEDFIIHTDELGHPTNPKSDPRNGIMRVPQKRAEFYGWANDFVERSNISCVFSVILKTPFYHKYKYRADPYRLSFENILNRVLYYSSSNTIGIYPECRNPELDRQLEAEYGKFCVQGTAFHSAKDVQKRIKKFECKNKKENISGLQIADLVVNPVGRHFLGYKPKPVGNEIIYEAVRKKLAGSEKLSISVLP